MSAYTPSIGLEIHAELKTRTKMFCTSKNDADESRPNANVCPVCMGHPGTLPVINREAVHRVLQVGTAIGGTLADYTEFDRKNYFYPDLPKGYQVSQYEYPLVSGGALSGVAITRIHLEEDTASSIHDESAGATSIDFNRAGVPLMELVTEPIITDSEQAGEFARELQLLLRYLNASDANMEKGEMRVEANVSVSKSRERGTKVEIKNLNSFRAMERAIQYEIKRQTAMLEKGEKVVQETRGWDESKQSTFPQRVKEGSADYRYFPDPDLPSLRLSEIVDMSKDMLAKSMPELPWQRRERYLALGLKAEDAGLLAQERSLGAYFDEVVTLVGSAGKAVQLAANYLTNDLVKIIRDTQHRDSEYLPDIPISARKFKEIIDLLLTSQISSRVAKDLLLVMAKGESLTPAEYIEVHDLSQASGVAVEALVDKVLTEHVSAVEDLRKGKKASLEYLVGQVMKAARGSARPDDVRTCIESKMG